MNFSRDYLHLARATDADHMAACFATQLRQITGPEVVLDGVQIPRVFPRSDGGFVVQYRLRLSAPGGTPVGEPVYCGLLPHPGGDLPAWTQGHGERVITLRDPLLALPILPFDPGLPELPRLLDRDTATTYVRGQLGTESLDVGAPPDWAVTNPRILGYRLERRCTIRLELKSNNRPTASGEPSYIVAKAVRAGRLKAIMDGKQQLEKHGFTAGTGGEMTVPRTLAIDLARGIQLLEFSPGQALHDLLGDSELDHPLALTGRLLARLHGVPPGTLPRFGVDEELKLLESRLIPLCTIFPEWASDIERVMGKLRTHAPAISPSPALIHRDFYDKQVLYTRERITLLDFDNLAAGDPALDYGNFCAHLVLRRHQVPTSAESLKRAEQVFKTAYGPRDEAFSLRAAWWQAAATARLAALYSLRPRWRKLARPILNTAEMRLVDLKANGVSLA